MKAISTVFGKFLVSVMIVFTLVASSCNTQRSEDVRVRERNDGSRDMRIRERSENDSVTYEREKTIRQDQDGDRKIKEETDVDRSRQNPDMD